MHPAYSVIIFTTASGAGYGLLFWLSLSHAVGGAPDDHWFLFSAIAVALVLITVGLMASTLHLGHPERAFRAFSQWRTSWLSREGVAAVVTYAPSGLLALIWLLDIDTNWTVPLAVLSALGAIVTVYCTGMIYASLRTIRQWHHGLVPLNYLALSAATGALLFGFLLGLFGYAPPWAATLSLLTLGAAAVMKVLYWQVADADTGCYTDEMATGLRHLGSVKPLDPPHTRPNFVLREMGYVVARKHADKLRRFVLLSLFAGPALMLLLLLTLGWGAPFLYLVAVALASAGVLTERWLFFAEATHVVTLYYGAQVA
jgi:sulfite dehydrogenase (quinone) subunit SoeC